MKEIPGNGSCKTLDSNIIRGRSMSISESRETGGPRTTAGYRNRSRVGYRKSGVTAIERMGLG